MAVKAVFFDMDGLVIDSEITCFAVEKDVLARQGYEMTIEKYTQITGKRGDDIRKTQEEMFPGLDFDRYQKEFMEEFVPRVIDVPQEVKPGFFELIAALDERGIKKYIVTSTRLPFTMKKLTLSGILDCFDEIITGEMVKRSKPAPDMYLHALEKSGFRKEDCLVLEDSIAGVGAAINAEIPCICVPDLIVPPEELTCKCLCVAKTLADAIGYLD